MLSIFKNTSRYLKSTNQVIHNSILVDFHAKILPNLDDGIESIEQSIVILRELSEIGYKKVIATPHIMHGYYRNTPEKIEEAASIIREALKEKKINIDLQTSAEYYLDQWFLNELRQKRPLLSFGEAHNRYLLFETPLINPPSFLFEAIELIKKAGYKPVLAHPENYIYLQKNFEIIDELALNGVLFQINFSSLFNFKNGKAKKLAETIIEKHLASFIGTNCKIEQLQEVRKHISESNWNQNFSNFTLFNKSKVLA